VNDIIMIDGPNGAGKTMAARTSLPRVLGLREFVNAGNIVLGLSPFNPEGVAVAAGRVMLDPMRELARDGTSFALETTRTGRGHARFLKERQEQGWRVGPDREKDPRSGCWLSRRTKMDQVERIGR
jgi:predicted ABC-type ATPase